jgi:hypothetical protein
MDKEEIKQIAYDFTTSKVDAEKLEEIILSLFPVSFSLPTDEEILDKHNSLKTVHGEVLKHTKDKLHRIGYYRGARWMRELISNES